MKSSRASFLGDGSHRLALGAACALFLAAFFPTLVEMVEEWLSRPEYSHGFLMPLVAAWVLWDRRKKLTDLRPQASLAGALLLVCCLGFLLLGEMKLSWFLKPYAFVVGLAALLWAFYGFRAVRACFPAFVILFLMCPLPGRVEQALTLPLKRSAALFATGLLDVTGIHATLDGNLIHLPHMHAVNDLFVANACSGIRSLISLLSLAIVVCFFWKRHWLLKGAMLVSAVPIAIFVNGMRIWVSGYLSVHVSPEAAEGALHKLEGFTLFVLAALFLWGWTALLAKVFDFRKPTGGSGAAGTPDSPAAQEPRTDAAVAGEQR